MKDKPKNNDKIFYSIVAVIAIVCILISSIFMIKNRKSKDEEKDLAYTELIKMIDEEKIEKIEMTVGSTSIKVMLKGEKEEDAKSAIVPSTQAFIELIQDKVGEGKEIELIQKPLNAFVRIGEVLLNFLPTLMFLALFILVFQMQGLGDKGKVYDAESHKNTNITFKDVAGLDEEKNEGSFWQNKYLWIMIVILVILFSIVGIILGKRFREHARRKRINEVDDDNFDYDQPENEDKRLFKNDENSE